MRFGAIAAQRTGSTPRNRGQPLQRVELLIALYMDR